ncbi:MAG: guanylate kinase [Erysipelotrichaceae bacterium]|jgi:guanylate kinase|nr:guanylate kinase [Erysipelotrichaceae bacterium]
MSKGLLIVLSGPSGVGKGTVLKEVMKDESLKLAFSISMTTRAKREGEEDGVNYFFVTRDEFEQAVRDGKMLEYAEFVGNYYGTPLEYVEKLRNEGMNVILEIEVQGCMQVREKEPDALTIFIVPPSMEELESRIRGRKTEAEEIIQQRLAKAESEMEMLNKYKYVVCNDDVKLAADIISVIIRRHMEKAQGKD